MLNAPPPKDGYVFADTVLDNSKYVPETEQLLCANTEISAANALKVNRQMQRYLNDLSCDLHRLLDTCRAKYEHNVRLLDQMHRVQSDASYSRTLYCCGYPFFKNRGGSGPPLSRTYQRRRQAGELFPMDLRAKRTSWLHADKIRLVQGVKSQALAFLRAKGRAEQVRAARMRTGARAAGGKADQRASSLSPVKEGGDNLTGKRLIQLLALTEATDFQINWLSISMNHLDERHSSNECMGMWYNYLMPSLNRKMWTPDEEDQLLDAIAEYGEQNWTEISLCIANRSPYQCFVHYQTVFGQKPLQKNVPWTRDEDRQLFEYVDKYRIGNIIPWAKITEMMPNRVRVQVYNRYMFSLNPQIKRSAFTTDEDCILMAAVKEHGINFRDFPTNLLPGRNNRQLRNRYNNVLRHVGKREHWTEDHDIKLVQLVDELGTANWLEVAKRIAFHSRTSCRQRYMTIKKFLDKNPNASIWDVPRRRKAFSTSVTADNWMETMLSNHAMRDAAFAGLAAATAPEQTAAVAVQKPATSTASRAIIMKANERALFEYLKYGYNFEWGRRITGNDGLVENFQIAGELLSAPAVSVALNMRDRPFSEYVTLDAAAEKAPLQPELRTQLTQLSRGEFRFPVNMNTLLGLRGLVIAFEGNKKKRPKVESMAHERQNAALALFEQRFMSVFANTAEVAKMTGSKAESVRLGIARKRKRKHPSSTVTSGVLEATAVSEVGGAGEEVTGAELMAAMNGAAEFGPGLGEFEPQPSTSDAFYSHPNAFDANGAYATQEFECSAYKIEYQPYASDTEGVGGDDEAYAMHVVVCDPMRLNEMSDDGESGGVTVPKMEKQG